MSQACNDTREKWSRQVSKKASAQVADHTLQGVAGHGDGLTDQLLEPVAVLLGQHRGVDDVLRRIHGYQQTTLFPPMPRTLPSMPDTPPQPGGTSWAETSSGVLAAAPASSTQRLIVPRDTGRGSRWSNNAASAR